MAIIAIVGIIMGFVACDNGNDNPTPPETFTVTFHANGGTPEPAQQTIEKDGKATEPPAMTKTNNDFDGWYKESGFITKWNFATNTVTADIDLYAKWEAYYSKLPNGINIYKDDATLTDDQMATAIANITTAVGWLTDEELTIIKNNVSGIKIIGAGNSEAIFSKVNGKYVIEMKTLTIDESIYYAFYDIAEEISGS